MEILNTVNIPQYRAKKIDSDEYVEGYYFKDSKCDVILTHSKTDYTDDGMYIKAIMIDITTLAINFPDMLDSEGNKIFASLSVHSKGGDILLEAGRMNDKFNPIYEPYFRESSFSIEDLPTTTYGNCNLKHYKVIGIQKDKY